MYVRCTDLTHLPHSWRRRPPRSLVIGCHLQAATPPDSPMTPIATTGTMRRLKRRSSIVASDSVSVTVKHGSNPAKVHDLRDSMMRAALIARSLVNLRRKLSLANRCRHSQHVVQVCILYLVYSPYCIFGFTARRAASSSFSRY